MKKLFAVAALLILGSQVRGQIVMRFPQGNSEHGCCGPATLVTVAAQHGRQMPGYLEGLRKQPFGKPVVYERGCPADRPHACQTPGLQKLGQDAARYGIATDFRQGGDTSLFNRGVPVIVGLNPAGRCQGGHIVAYVGNGLAYDPNYRANVPMRWDLWRGDSLSVRSFSPTRR